MRKIVIKILIAFTVVIVISNIFLIQNVQRVLAMGDVSENLDYWESVKNSGEGSNALVNKVGIIVGAMQVIGAFICIASLMIIGIKYMYSSVEERANYKQTLIPWVVGACMVLAITSLPGVIYDAVKSNSNMLNIDETYNNGWDAAEEVVENIMGDASTTLEQKESAIRLQLDLAKRRLEQQESLEEENNIEEGYSRYWQGFCDRLEKGLREVWYN